MDTISTQLTQIQDAIQTQTCVDALSSSSVNNTLTSIATVANTYTQLLQAGEDPNGSVSQADIDNFLDEVNDGPGGGLPPIDAALNSINIALQSTNSDGIIGVCEKANTTLPTTGSFAADLTFYSDPLNLLQYFADYQTIAALLLVEYYHYQAFVASPYYSTTVISNGLPAGEAPLVCSNPTGETATQCGFARDITEEVYVYLQNQYSANGVPYSSDNTSGNLATELYDAGDNNYYLLATSIEDFTNNEDPTRNNCPSVMTESDGCGIAFGSDLSTDPFGSDLPIYYYETAWSPITAELFRTLLDNFNSGNGSTTVASAPSSIGFQNTANKIILTQQTYSADPKVPNPGGTLAPIPGASAACFMDTNLDRTFSMQPFCYNGSNNGVDYGDVGTTMWLWDTWNGGDCMTFRSINTVLDTENQSFYGDTYTYDSYLNFDGDPSGSCTNGAGWVDGFQPGWLTTNGNDNASANGFFRPMVDISTLTCGTNLSYGVLQPAVTRTASNLVGVPTMCGADFDAYFANIQPRNPYLQVAFVNTATAATTSSIPNLLMTIQLQDVSSGVAVAATVSTDTVVNLTSTSATGVFSQTNSNGFTPVTSITIPANNSSAFVYYGDTTAGLPQIIADTGTIVPANQFETIATASQQISGTATHLSTNAPNGKVTIRGEFTVPQGIQLPHALLTIEKLLSEDAGAGELVHDARGHSLQLPVTLHANTGGSATAASYESSAGTTPHVRVEITLNKHHPTAGEFKIKVDRAQLLSPSTCSGKPQQTQLHTRMIANDSTTNSLAAVDTNVNWICGKAGKLVTAR